MTGRVRRNSSWFLCKNRSGTIRDASRITICIVSIATVLRQPHSYTRRLHSWAIDLSSLAAIPPANRKILGRKDLASLSPCHSVAGQLVCINDEPQVCSRLQWVRSNKPRKVYPGLICLSNSKDTEKKATLRFVATNQNDESSATDCTAIAASQPAFTTPTDPSTEVQSPVLCSPGSLMGSNFEVGAVIGTGGMGIVYAGNDILLGRPVAIKIINRQASAIDVTESTDIKETL